MEADVLSGCDAYDPNSWDYFNELKLHVVHGRRFVAMRYRHHVRNLMPKLNFPHLRLTNTLQAVFFSHLEGLGGV